MTNDLEDEVMPPNPDEMLQLLRHISVEHGIHGRLVTTLGKLQDFLKVYDGEPDPNCLHEATVVISKYKWGSQLKNNERVKTAMYCGDCKRKI